MEFHGRTPEYLIPRSDSRNPATTCKGITKAGRPCRRAIDAKASHDNGVLAVVSVVSRDSLEDDRGAAAFFCWQHKDQAERLVARSPGQADAQETRIYPLQERSSIDTLVARLGVLKVESPPAGLEKRRRSRHSNARIRGHGPSGNVHRPPKWDHVQGPLLEVPQELMEKSRRSRHQPDPHRRQSKASFWKYFCCIQADHDESLETVRRKRRPHGDRPAPTVKGHESMEPSDYSFVKQASHGAAHIARIPDSLPRPQSTSIPTRKSLAEKKARPVNKTVRSSETAILLSQIPESLSPQTTSALLAELSKPISEHDEDGYIYIFWLTDETLGPAPESTASTLLAPLSRPENNRSTSEVLRQYSVRKRKDNRSIPVAICSNAGNVLAAPHNSILLKIGRANNVTRRMNEWTRQCGYALSLVRWYPYVPSGSTSSASPLPRPSPQHAGRASNSGGRRLSESVRKVPHAHRVERLIHIELADKRVVKKCQSCGKDHREWFEVDASREGVKQVDAVVRRWVNWAENLQRR